MVTDSLSDREILALTIIGESRGEPIEGQVAVANVIKNRVLRESKTYKQICLAPLQFSCWNQSDPNYSYLEDLANKIFDAQPSDIHLKQCIYVAEGVMDDNIADNTNGAIHYLANNLKVQPVWAQRKLGSKIIGNQIFFNV